MKRVLCASRVNDTLCYSNFTRCTYNMWNTYVCLCLCVFAYVRVLYLFTCDPHNENVFNHCPLQSFASGTSTLPFPVVQLNGRCVRFHSRSPTETTPSPSIHPSPLCTQMKLHVEMEFEVFLIRRFSYVFPFCFWYSFIFSLFI